MLKRTEAIFNHVKDTIQPANKDICDSGIVSKVVNGKMRSVNRNSAIVEFYRKVNDLLNNQLQVLFISYLENKTIGQAREMKSLFYYELVSILANIYQTGRCDEMASTTLLQCLKAGIKNKIHMIAVQGDSLPGGYPAHAFVGIGEIEQDILSWKKCLILDPWGNFSMKLYLGNESPTFRDIEISSNLRRIKNSEILFSINRSLIIEDYEFFKTFLAISKNYITPDLLKTAMADAHNLIPIDPMHEMQKIHASIDEEIKKLDQLIQSPPQIFSIVFSEKKAEEKIIDSAYRLSSLISHNSPIHSDVTQALQPFRKNKYNAPFFKVFDAKDYNRALRMLCNDQTPGSIEMVKIMLQSREQLGNLNANDRSPITNVTAFDYASLDPDLYAILSSVWEDASREENHNVYIDEFIKTSPQKYK